MWSSNSSIAQNIDHYQPLLAVGTRTGSVQIFNLSTGVQAFEFSLHTAAVKGIEWVSACWQVSESLQHILYFVDGSFNFFFLHIIPDHSSVLPVVLRLDAFLLRHFFLFLFLVHREKRARIS